MTFNYDAGYGEKDVLSLFDAIAPNLRKSAGDVAGLEASRLYETLKRVYEEWKALEDFEVLDRNFQALLATAAATSWFTKEQLDDIDTWLGEVADCGESEDWMQHFPEEELREVVLEKLRAREAQVVFDTVAKAISVEYEGGNFGTGRHDGSIQLNDEGLSIRDSREPGKSMVFLGDLPEDPAQLGKALGSRNWDEHWDEDLAKGVPTSNLSDMARLQYGSKPHVFVFVAGPRVRHLGAQEIWVMNTAYCLYASDAPLVSLEATHWGRLDEMAKCLAVASADAVVRLFWADAVISVEGDDLSTWMRFVGKRAPTEQQTCQFLWPNIVAAGKGRPACRTAKEAMESWTAHGHDEPTPGIDVRKPKISEELLKQDLENSCFEWPRQPTAESAQNFLKKLQKTWRTDTGGTSRPTVVGMLLDIDGVMLKPYCASPLSRPTRDVGEPKVCVTVLGGPKGISPSFKECLQEIFCALAIPLLEVRLGPHEEMAHACLAHLRLQDDAGLLKAAVTDLLRLGMPPQMETTLLQVSVLFARSSACLPARVHDCLFACLFARVLVCCLVGWLLVFVLTLLFT
ncbi:unnamed protein product [Symbiodinium natans]|uniref:Uncharacterized protein n=1 Tax=Symbiodinium natans TaxID=878477 RepID=A0A812HBG6_9DINO|nr:unnamed protein product [Symbiodinium natans]